MGHYIDHDGTSNAPDELVSLWRHADFVWLWSANTVAQLGTRVGQIVIPLVALTVVGATPFEIGLLTAAGTVGALLFGLPAGVWVDRLSRRRVLLTTDFTRMLLLATIPLSAYFGVLSIQQLLITALLVSIATIFFDVAQLAYLPTLVNRDRLVDANAKLQGSYAVAAVGGPSLGGLASALVGAVNAVWATALTFLTSALLLRNVRTHDSESTPRNSGGMTLTDIAAGLRYVLNDRSLRAIGFCTGTGNLFMAMITAMLVLFLTHDLGLSPTATGLVIASSGVGGVFAALTANRWSRALGQSRMILLSLLLTQPLGLIMGLAQPGPGAALVACGWFSMGYGSTLYNIVQVSFRQGICPSHLLGRVQASNRFLAFAMAPVGGLLGGVSATWLGVRTTLLLGVAGMILSTLWLILWVPRTGPPHTTCTH